MTLLLDSVRILTPNDLALGLGVPAYPDWHRNQRDESEYSLYTLVDHDDLREPRIFRLHVGTNVWSGKPGILVCRHRPLDNHTRHQVPWDVLLEETFAMAESRERRVRELRERIGEMIFAKALRQLLDEKL